MTRTARNWCLVIASILVMPGFLEACLWDTDTLLVERSRFPNALELITGQFPWHSERYYEWRVEDRLEKLKRDPENLVWLDDLAVAYDKLGRDDEAIAIMEQKESISPGLYETAANLGTFRIHAGDLSGGLVDIARALKINPHAHFDREVYQQYLVQYVLKHRVDGETKLPISQFGESFDAYLAEQLTQSKKSDDLDGAKPDLTPAQREAAVKGVLGILRFGSHDSPILMEALGSLLVVRYDVKDAKQLAARAYLRAAETAKQSEAKSAYRKLAEEALQMQVVPKSGHKQMTLAMLEREFQKERTAADKWHATLASNEALWIKQGRDVDAEFQKRYLAVPKTSLRNDLRSPILGGLLTISLIAIISTVLIRRRNGQAV